jgi:hypothetical protein
MGESQQQPSRLLGSMPSQQDMRKIAKGALLLAFCSGVEAFQPSASLRTLHPGTRASISVQSTTARLPILGPRIQKSNFLLSLRASESSTVVDKELNDLAQVVHAIPALLSSFVCHACIGLPHGTTGIFLLPVNSLFARTSSRRLPYKTGEQGKHTLNIAECKAA